jgi:hypothetical protein
MQARIEPVISLDNMIAGSASLIGAAVTWVAIPLLATATQWDLTVVDKLLGAGGAATVLFFALRWTAKRNDHTYKELIEAYKTQITEQNATQKRMVEHYEARLAELEKLLHEKD